MPVTIIFTGYASINKVKNMYWGVSPGHETLNLKIYDVHYQQDSDKGTTGDLGYPYYIARYHMRVYAHHHAHDPEYDDHDDESFMGDYITATTHVDSPYNGYSEDAAQYFIDHAAYHGCYSYGQIDFQNAWIGSGGGPLAWNGHNMQSNGMAVLVYVPQNLQNMP